VPDLTPLPHRLQSLLCALDVVRMDEVEEGAGQQFLRCVTQRALEGRVHALPVPVEVGDPDQIQRRLDDALHLTLPTPAADDRVADQEREKGDRDGPRQRQPREQRPETGRRREGDAHPPRPRQRIEIGTRRGRALKLTLEPAPVHADLDLPGIVLERQGQPAPRDEHRQVPVAERASAEAEALDQVEARLTAERGELAGAGREHRRLIVDGRRQG
jgi:hypothetical protein